MAVPVIETKQRTMSPLAFLAILTAVIAASVAFGYLAGAALGPEPAPDAERVRRDVVATACRSELDWMISPESIRALKVMSVARDGPWLAVRAECRAAGFQDKLCRARLRVFYQNVGGRWVFHKVWCVGAEGDIE